MSKRRMFIAVPLLQEDYLEYCLQLQHEMKSESLRWTPQENLHLTAVFLGEQEEPWIPSIIKELKSFCESLKAFSLAPEKLMSQSFQHSSMLWLRFKDSQQWTQMTNMLRAQFLPQSQEREQIPHLTLARYKNTLNDEDATFIPSSSISYPQFSFLIDKLSLYESHLSSEGAKYQILHTFPFSGEK